MIVQIELKEVKKVCITIFNRFGTSPEVSEIVVDDLIGNELDKYHSHGLMRMIEYAQSIQDDMLDIYAKPTYEYLSDIVVKIDGHRSFGSLVQRLINDKLLQLLARNKFGFLTFSNSGHISRLHKVVEPVVSNNGIVIGFMNYSGSGQNVIPFRGTSGKLCTNPIVFGVPSKKGMVIIDFSTSTLSEGKLRNAYYQGLHVPEGILVDTTGAAVTDPALFYKHYNKVFLTPLGGADFGYKGFGLALFVEIMAGILSGGGFSSPQAMGHGNAGTFIVFSAELFNLSNQDLQHKVEELIQYLRDDPKQQVKIPGYNRKPRNRQDFINIPQKVWDKLIALYKNLK